jgi:hypothetical protein
MGLILLPAGVPINQNRATHQPQDRPVPDTLLARTDEVIE